MDKLCKYIDKELDELENKVGMGGKLSRADIEDGKNLAKFKMAILTKNTPIHTAVIHIVAAHIVANHTPEAENVTAWDVTAVMIIIVVSTAVQKLRTSSESILKKLCTQLLTNTSARSLKEC